MNVTYEQYDRLITFLSVHDAIRAEKTLTAEGIKTVDIPTPREIHLSCGASLLLSSTDEAAALAALAGTKARWNRLYRREAANRLYEMLKEYQE